MKLAHWAISALMMAGTAGAAFAQAPAQVPCTPEPAAEGGFTAGNRTSLNPVMNADTDLPADSPLAGLPHPYRQEFDWARMPAGRIWGDSRAIAIDKDGKSIWVLDRCGLMENACSRPENRSVNPLMKFDPQGNMVKAFGAGMFSSPHGLSVDAQGNLWTTDGQSRGCQDPGAPVGNLLRKWSPDGKLLMTISGPQGGKPFTGLNDVVVSPVNGDIFLADGHMRGTANDRVIKFDRNGKYLMEWGTPGKEDSQIGIPHGLTMDHEGRIYVADRSNNAVKVYDQNGKLLNVWHQFGSPSGVYVDKNDLLYVADETANNPNNPKLSPGVRIAHTDGKIIANIPYRPGNALEGVTVDADGNVYGANTNHPRSVRWVKTGAL